MKELNANETIVWEALVKASDFQGHDFGFVDDAWKSEHYPDLLDPSVISKRQFAGYVSQLQSKGYIFCLGDDDPSWENGFYLTQAGAKFAGIEYYSDNHPDRA